MGYRDFMSKTDDVVWLAYQLKDKLGSKISINKFGLYKEVLEGRYLLKGYDRGIDFNVLYSNNEFLSFNVGETCAWAKYEDKLFVLNEIKNAISCISRNDILLGEPTIFYNISEDEYKVPNLEYIYADRENAIKAFMDKTIFDDGVPEDLIVFDSVKEKEEFGIAKGYSYVTHDTQSKYSINIYAMLKNKSDIAEKELKNVMIENLDELFNNFNESLLEAYVTSNNDIAYIVAYIKNALSLAEEVELSIIIREDGKEIKRIKYKEGILVYYDCCCEFGECIMNTNYSYKDGIKFETKCDSSAYDLIEDVVRNELQNINVLKDVNNQYNIKSNDNLLKLVRRIGNK